MFQLREAVGDGRVERHEERQLAGVFAQGGVQLRRDLRAPVGVGIGVGDLLDELPERHREPVPPDRFPRHQRAGRHDRVAAVGEPARDIQLQALLGDLRIRISCHRARQDCRHPHHYRRRRKMHDDGEHVVQHARLSHGEPDITARGSGSGDRPVRAGG